MVNQDQQNTAKPNRDRVLIMGAAGRDFHNFNVCFRDNPRFEIVAFTAAQSGAECPHGIPIYPEDDLEKLLRDLRVQQVVFAYSDLSHVILMHIARRTSCHPTDP